MEPIVTEREYLIHYYEVDYKKRALITSIMDYFGDMAMYQSDTLGIGIKYIEENNLAWVMYKWDININRYPKYGEKIKVITKAEGFKKFYAYRSFEIKDNSGEVIVKANSIWLLINIKRRKPVRISDDFYTAYSVPKDKSDFEEIENIKILDKIDNEKVFNVRYSDIDTNRHVNNVKYAAWAIEVVPKEVVIDYKLNNLKVIYKKETGYGQAIKSAVQINHINKNKIICIHNIMDQEDKKLTEIETVWVK